MHRRDKAYLNILTFITRDKKYWRKPHQPLKNTLSVAHLYFVIDQILTLVIFCKKTICRFFSLPSCIHCINFLLIYFIWKQAKSWYHYRNNQYVFLYGMSRMYTISKGDISHKRKRFCKNFDDWLPVDSQEKQNNWIYDKLCIEFTKFEHMATLETFLKTTFSLYKCWETRYLTINFFIIQTPHNFMLINIKSCWERLKCILHTPSKVLSKSLNKLILYAVKCTMGPTRMGPLC